jgi:hypothetical protein
MSASPRSPKELTGLLDSLRETSPRYSSASRRWSGLPCRAAGRRPPAARRRARRRQDAAGQGPGPQPRCKFQRIQFTPDLLPGDLIGTTIFREKTGEFVFQPGPLFAQVVLADEINRATPAHAVGPAGGDERAAGHGGRDRPTRSARRFWSSPRRTRTSSRAPTRCPRASSTGSCCARGSATPTARPSGPSSPSTARASRSISSSRPDSPRRAGAAEHTRAVRVDPAIADYILDLIDATRDARRGALGASTRAATGPLPRRAGAGRHRRPGLRRPRRREGPGRAGAGPPAGDPRLDARRPPRRYPGRPRGARQTHGADVRRPSPSSNGWRRS